MLKHKYRSRKFALLRALMRRYGWDRRSEQGGTCRWSQTFKDVRKSEDWSAFAWFLAAELYILWLALAFVTCAAPLRSPRQGAARTASTDTERQLRDDLIAWQVVEGCSRIPSSEEHPQLAKRVETSGASARLKALKKAYPPDFAPLAAFALDCLAEGADSQAGVLWRSVAERALVFGIPGWREDGPRKQQFASGPVASGHGRSCE